MTYTVTDYNNDIDTLLGIAGYIEPILMLLPVRLDNAVVTAAVSNKEIILSPKFMSMLTPRERYFVLLHECKHLEYGHVTDVVDGLDPETVNKAMDSVINQHIIDDFGVFVDVPELAVKPRSFYTDRDVSWREVYDILKERGEDGSGAGGKPFDVHIIEADGQASDELKASVAQAKIQSEAIKNGLSPMSTAGTSAGRADIDASQVRLSKYDWTSRLDDLLATIEKRDSPTWQRVDRRAFAHGRIEQSRTRRVQCLPDIDVYVDTSGSNVENAGQLMGDLIRVIKQRDIKSLRIIPYDVQAYDPIEVSSAEDIPTLLEGGGGTSIMNALEGADTMRTIIVMTDGEDNMSCVGVEAKPSVWVVYGTSEVGGTGITVHVDLS